MPQGRTWRTTNDNTRSYFYRSFFCRRNRRCKRGKHAHNAHSAGAYHRILLFLHIRPEKKRNKEMQNMLNSIQVADEVITNGGIIGRVLSVKEDTVLIETGSDRTKIRVLKSAIAKNNTVHEASAEEAPAKKKKGDKPAEIK